MSGTHGDPERRIRQTIELNTRTPIYCADLLRLKRKGIIDERYDHEEKNRRACRVRRNASVPGKAYSGTSGSKAPTRRLRAIIPRPSPAGHLSGEPGTPSKPLEVNTCALFRRLERSDCDGCVLRGLHRQ